MFRLTGVVLFFGLLALASPVQAQERCGTVAYENLRRQQNPSLETKAQFETWMAGKLAQLKKQPGARSLSSTYTIPVVIHIIYNASDSVSAANGNSPGTFIPDAQVQSQIDRINIDYPRLNADTTNTPAEFKPVAAGIKINFVLARQDPEGLPTTGITRTVGKKTAWTLDDTDIFKAQAFWPAENYLNIWVLNLVDPSGVIGYSQLPVSSLAGLNEASHDKLTDGVAIHYQTFGTDNIGSTHYGTFDLITGYDGGRTATHEIGHILGLRHVWGDENSCSSTDYVADTPIQDAPTYGCPSTTDEKMSCGHDKMYQNYMDYTDDPCYNLFTQDQIARMIVVLANSPRRASLLVSPGATAPTTVANDLGIRRIINPATSACPASISPSLQVRNYGNNTVTSSRIQFSLNGTMTETKDFTLNLGPLDTTTVSFSPVGLTASTTDLFSFTILLTNGGTDGKASNDSSGESVIVPAIIPVPFLSTFSSLPTGWQILNRDSLITWQITAAPNSDPANNAIYMDFFDYVDQGTEDYLTTGVFDLSSDTIAVLKFDWAYAQYSGYSDQLQVLVSQDCDFSNGAVVFNKSGSALATSATTSDAFVPASASDWKTATIPLTQYLGQSHVQVRFDATNGNGNNLYLDNVTVITGAFTDLTLVGAKQPSLVTCDSDPTPVLTVRNNGSTTITSVTFTTTINGGSATPQTISGLQLVPGADHDFTLPAWALNQGLNKLIISVQNNNGFSDIVPGDNTLTLNEVVSTVHDIIPIRENFESNFPEWTTVSPTQGVNWTPVTTPDRNKGTSLEYAGFTNTVLGSQAWLVSPTLDFSTVSKAGLFFDLSYGLSGQGTDDLQVLASTDCGETFPIVVFDQSSGQLETGISNSAWTPQVDTDWKRQFVDLDTLVGNANARLAFVVTNGNGNNLFIDNVEIFIDDNPAPVAVETLYSVYENYQPNFKITFNLPERQTVRMQIYSTMGQIVLDNQLPDVLNQTYDVDLTGKGPGVYVVRLQIGNQLSTAKVVVGQ
jgi:archaellum component FlaF (FlaF/FlaG flagellin family)